MIPSGVVEFGFLFGLAGLLTGFLVAFAFTWNS